MTAFCFSVVLIIVLRTLLDVTSIVDHSALFTTLFTCHYLLFELLKNYFAQEPMICYVRKLEEARCCCP
jgi:hypothetical protein